VRPSVTSLLRRPDQSKQEVTTDWQTETFCCITTSPSPAPMMEPNQVAGRDGHLPPTLLPGANYRAWPTCRYIPAHDRWRAPASRPGNG